MLLSDDHSDDLVREEDIEEEPEDENEEELSARCGREDVSLFKFKGFKYFKPFQSLSKTWTNRKIIYIKGML